MQHAICVLSDHTRDRRRMPPIISLSMRGTVLFYMHHNATDFQSIATLVNSKKPEIVLFEEWFIPQARSR